MEAAIDENSDHPAPGRWQGNRPRAWPSVAIEALLAPLLTPRFHEGPRARPQRCRRPSWPPAPMASAPWSAARPGAIFRSLRSAPRRRKRRARPASPKCATPMAMPRRWPWPQPSGRPGRACCCMSAAKTRRERLAENLTLRGFKVRRCQLYAIEPATGLPAGGAKRP